MTPKMAKAMQDRLDEDSQIEKELQKFRSMVSRRLPKTPVIASMAAALAHGRPITSDSLKSIAEQAIELFEICEAARKGKIDRLALYARARANAEARPKPKKYPVSLDEFLRLAMPDKKRPEDRMKYYREWLRGCIRTSKYLEASPMRDKEYDSVPIPSDEEVAAVIAKDIQSGFNEAAYANAYGFFTKWIPKYAAENRRERASAGAKGKLKKKSG
ncbi:MAG: hypothetical protein HZA89_06070 [Verrucomicrobia bacterium]|nr:hypothetical protein [Verrucomicrobiota bacterium]